jgi:hypothetical protein
LGGLDVRLTTLLCKTIIFAKSKEVNTIKKSLAESSKESCGSKKGCFDNDDD